MLWVVLAAIYIALGVGLYCKTYTMNKRFYGRNKAFLAPLFWILALIYLLFDSSFNEKGEKKAILTFVLFHPYLTMLACCLILTDERKTKLVQKEGSKKTCKRIARTYRTGLEKYGIHLA